MVLMAPSTTLRLKVEKGSVVLKGVPRMPGQGTSSPEGAESPGQGSNVSASAVCYTCGRPGACMTCLTCSRHFCSEVFSSDGSLTCFQKNQECAQAAMQTRALEVLDHIGSCRGRGRLNPDYHGYMIWPAGDGTERMVRRSCPCCQVPSSCPLCRDQARTAAITLAIEDKKRQRPGQGKGLDKA